ncbi:hypothetical protein KK062_20930 [Fulvivirgaceae bacterium PWU5]|uniref:Uncharacterized protein n=1 Tax=Dawidia cretensis TaxID=2782350 RepID=A0AAP2E2B1_9BACT|nr:hypothetical protein [Dawidia cretensis]MBT1710718.1 hypothetical protein [Dawidia cretensis]
MKKLTVFYLLVVLLTVALPAASQRRRSATLNNASVSAQVLPRQQEPQLQRVSPAVREYIRPTEKVEVLQADGSKELLRRDEIKVEDGRQTIQYSSALGKLDEKETRMVVGKMEDSLASKIDVSQLKIIPELHFEKSSSDGTSRTYRIAFASNVPLEFNAEKDVFTGAISFLLVDESGDAAALDKPIPLQITSNTIRTITPKSLELSHLFLPLSDVELMERDVQDSALVKLVTNFNPNGYDVFVPVKPALQLSIERKSMQGLGIQEVPVTIRYIGSNSGKSRKVILQAERGTITPSAIEVKYNEPVTVMLRSEGIGDVTISVEDNTQRSEITVAYTFPWVFLVAALGGGLFGALLTFLKGGKKFSLKPFLYAALIGLLCAAAYYVLGLNLLDLKVSEAFNEVAVGTFSALGAFFGVNRKKAAN